MLALEDIFLPGLPGRSPAVIEINRLPVDDAFLDEARRQGPNLALRLAAALALERQITLPAAASAHAERAIALDLRQSLPAQARGLIWSHDEIARDKAKVTYRAHILKEAPVLQLIEALHARGVRVESIAVSAAPKAPVWRTAPGQHASWKLWAMFAACVTAFMALGAVIALERRISEVNELVENRRTNVAALETRLSQARSAAAEGEARRLDQSEAQRRFESEARRLAVLTELSILLPDSVWVSELTMAGSRVTVAGFTSGDVAETIGLIQAASWAGSVALEGPVSFDSYSGQSRFVVAIELAGRAASP